ncbi:MAG: extracellular solute-binding protein [Clostridia bacterium]|nr:extracellular solute-binding protein [Clostridia bacterium]
MTKKKRITALILALLSAALLSACSYGVPEQTETDTEAVSSPETEGHTDPVKVHTYDPDNVVRSKAYLEEAPGGDLDGMDVFFSGPYVGTLSPDGATYISKEISERNRAVEEKLNVKLDFSAVEVSDMIADAASSVASGMYYTDVMLIPVSTVGTFYASGCLFNLESLPYFDLSVPYFNQRSVSAMSAGRYCLGFLSDAYPVLRETPALFYNRAIEGDDPGSLERAAKDGTLTWDTVLEKAEANLSLLGEGAFPVSVGNPTATFPQTVYLTGSGRIISTAADRPAVSIDPAVLAAASAVTGRISKSAPAKDEGAELFKNGKVAYRIEYVKNAATLNGETTEFGVVPLPKMTDADEYRAFVSPYCSVFTVIAGTKNSEEISLVLTSLSAASYGVIPEHYVDEVIVTSMRDDRSGDMLDLITKSAEFDLSISLSGISSAVGDATLQYISGAANGAGGDYEALAAAVNAFLADLFG